MLLIFAERASLVKREWMIQREARKGNIDIFWTEKPIVVERLWTLAGSSRRCREYPVSHRWRDPSAESGSWRCA